MGRGAGKNGASERKSAMAEKVSPQEKLEKLAKACAHEGDIEGVERILNKMCAGGEPRNMNHYHALVHACAQAGDVVRAQSYLRQMAEVGLAPNTMTYNLVINACASKGNVEEAEMWVMHMKKRGLAPTEVTYGTICKALARVGNIKRIEEIMAQLEQEGLGLNEYFFASLISACGAHNPPNLARAEKVPAEMISRGLSPKSVKRALDRVVGPKRANQLLTEQEMGWDERKSTAARSSTASTCSDPPTEQSTAGSWASGSPMASPVASPMPSRAASLCGSEQPSMPAGAPNVCFSAPAFPAAGAVPHGAWQTGAPDTRFIAPGFPAAGAVPHGAWQTGGGYGAGSGTGYWMVPAMTVPQAPPGYVLVMQPMAA